eukprot:3313840-Prymnesium_polylepis.2
MKGGQRCCWKGQRGARSRRWGPAGKCGGGHVGARPDIPRHTTLAAEPRCWVGGRRKCGRLATRGGLALLKSEITQPTPLAMVPPV